MQASPQYQGPLVISVSVPLEWASWQLCLVLENIWYFSCGVISGVSCRMESCGFLKRHTHRHAYPPSRSRSLIGAEAI